MAVQFNYTTAEQSEFLLKLGFPRESADCYIYHWWHNGNRNGEYNITPVHNKSWWEGHNNARYTPIWSVGRLIEIFDICGDKKQCAEELPLPSKINEVYETSYIDFLISVFATGITCFDLSKLKDAL